MALNPFFLQGSQSEQNLVQQLINEQLKIYGVEVNYIPRQILNQNSIIEEIEASKFDDNYLIEAYLSNYEGYSGAGDVMTKFGISIRDEVNLIISKERFEDFISPFLDALPDDQIDVYMRPREGDLIYFPLGGRLFEIKFVEHEQPFYQLGKTYVYELKCELFEYEDEIIDTSIEEIDSQIEEIGYITTLSLIPSVRTATATAAVGVGGINNVFINNNGYGYKTAPTVTFSDAPDGGLTARGVAITTSINGVYSIEKVLLVNAGFGYTMAPTITFSGPGVGAAATCNINVNNSGVYQISVVDTGLGYAFTPQVSFSSGGGSGTTASAIMSNSAVESIFLESGGSGYSSAPQVNIQNPTSATGIGTFIYNELVVGSNSGTTAYVRKWDADTAELNVSIISGEFFNGETIVGTASSATYVVYQYDINSAFDKYSQNEEIEQEADLILDFSEENPFGNY